MSPASAWSGYTGRRIGECLPGVYEPRSPAPCLTVGVHSCLSSGHTAALKSSGGTGHGARGRGSKCTLPKRALDLEPVAAKSRRSRRLARRSQACLQTRPMVSGH